MSLLEDLEKIQSARNDIKTALEEVTSRRVPKNIETYADKITGIKSSIDPSDIVQGKTVLGTVGTGTTGSDTSDATATADDIVLGKSAYISTGKVDGTIPIKDTLSIEGAEVSKIDTGISFKSTNKDRTVLESNSPINISSTNANISKALGLTSEKVASGNTILGVAGKTSVVDTATGTATNADIRLGKTAYVNGKVVTGNIQTVLEIAPSSTSTTVTKGSTNLKFEATNADIGYIDTNTNLSLEAPNNKIATAIGLTAPKIVKGNTILGIAGTGTTGIDTTSKTPVTASEMAEGKEAFVNGAKVVGELFVASDTEGKGYAIGTGMTKDDNWFHMPNCVDDALIKKDAIISFTEDDVASAEGLTSDMIVVGNTVLGVEGTGTTGIDTSDATATENDIASGQTAYVKGRKIEGSIKVAGDDSYENDGSEACNVITTRSKSIGIPEDEFLFHYQYDDGVRVIHEKWNAVSVTFPELANHIELTSDQLVKGNTVLGVEGDTNNVNTADTTANPSDILLGKTAYTKGAKITGTLPSLSSVTADTSKATVKEETAGLKITAGNSTIGAINNSTSIDMTVGKSAVASAISLTADKIIKGNTVLGIDGTGETGIDTTSTKPATATDIETGKEAFVNGAKVTGSLATSSSLSKTGATVTTETSSVKFASTNNTKSILNANATINVSASNSDVAEAIGLTSSKIAKGNTILGIAGSNNVVDTSEGDAVATNIESGKIAFVDGSKVTGSLSASSTLSKTGASVTTGTSALTFKSTNATKSILNANASISVSANNSNVATALDLTSDKIVSGNTILGVVGDTNNVDTSTGDASAANIEKGKIAFVKGSSVTGSLTTASSFSNTSPTITADNTGSTLKFASTISTKTIYNASSSVGLTATYSNVASKVGLTAAKLAKGQKVLGITGTYETDLSAEQAILDNILGR